MGKILGGIFQTQTFSFEYQEKTERRRKHINKMTSSVVHLDMELNENVEVGHQAAPVGVDPGVEGDVPPPRCGPGVGDA